MFPEKWAMKKSLLAFLIILIFLLSACQPTATQAQIIQVTLIHDQTTSSLSIPEGLTVQQILAQAGLSLNPLDTVTPALDSVIHQAQTIQIVRITETFEVEEKTLPFESQTVKNESLPVGQTLLIQAGENGVQSITYRVLAEDGVEQSRTVVKTETTQAAKPEIIMVGIQSPFKSVEISGTLAYISSANAWIMQANTGNRREVVNSGDLDGRIFALSPNQRWLLFSRSASEDEKQTINSLWVVDLTQDDPAPIALDIKNVVNYAEWVPGKEATLAYSTVEWRSTAPGWQANNDLQILTFGEDGKVLATKALIDTNTGGIYGWWGTSYSFSPDASEIAYARPDSIGLVDSKAGSQTPIQEFTPYQTQGDWAWVPQLAWTADHAVLYAVLPEADGTSFDLFAYLSASQRIFALQQNVGMFSYPVISPVANSGNFAVAYLSAINPEQSDTSKYELRVMDRDGSNVKKLFPGEGVQGLSPQSVVWAPSSEAQSVIAFIAQGNLEFVDPDTGAITQITGDGSVSKIDWK
jgi:hypothetical protein